MLYVIHNERGEILQANKLFADPEDYDDRLREMGHRFVKSNTSDMPHPEHWHVHNGEHRKRPEMFVVVSKTIIKAGGKDSAVLYGCPIGSTFSVMTGGIVVDSGILDDPELECPMPVPCKFSIILERWPYKTFKVDIEATA